MIHSSDTLESERVFFLALLALLFFAVRFLLFLFVITVHMRSSYLLLNYIFQLFSNHYPQLSEVNHKLDFLL